MAAIPDVPDKATLLTLDSLYGVIRNNHAVKGFVTWDSTPPANVCYQTHKFSFLDAVQTALAFLRTDFADEKLLMGPVVTAVVRTLPMFVENEPKQVHDCIELGRIGRMRVFADPNMENANHWYVVQHGEWVQGLVVNSPIILR